MAQFRIQKLRFLLLPCSKLYTFARTFLRFQSITSYTKVVKKSKTFSFIFRRKQRQFQDQLTSHHARQTQNILLLSIIEIWKFLESARIHANSLLLVLINLLRCIFLDHHQTFIRFLIHLEITLNKSLTLHNHLRLL
jgi:hypothetical protein